MLRIDWEILFK